jgi:hypothetical protein
MKRETAKARVEEFLEKLGVPAHCMQVKQVRPSVEFRVLLKGQEHIIRARSGITEGELEMELGRLQGAFNQRVRDGQVDIEDCTKKLEPAE